ncbi:hypothetical protein D033_1080A, partial [Vibrio parahaemolyticus B-265]
MHNDIHPPLQRCCGGKVNRE